MPSPRDLELYHSLSDASGRPFRVVILFAVTGETSTYITGIFRTSDDSEVDFKTLGEDERREIVARCVEEVKKRNNT